MRRPSPVPFPHRTGDEGGSGVGQGRHQEKHEPEHPDHHPQRGQGIRAQPPREGGVRQRHQRFGGQSPQGGNGQPENLAVVGGECESASQYPPQGKALRPRGEFGSNL